MKYRRKWISPTEPRHSFRVWSNRYREVQPTGITQVWVADLTYVRLDWEFVYLGVILDAFSRRVVGWALSRSPGASLTVAALRSALQDRCPPLGCIHHSDRGVHRPLQPTVADPAAGLPQPRPGQRVISGLAGGRVIR